MKLDLLPNKSPALCPVRFCRNPRSPKSHNKGGICSRCWMRQWRANNPVKATFAALRWSAKSRRKSLEITFQEFAEWCAKNNYIELRGREANCAQIDRIDYRRGYSLDNMQILSCSENSAKGVRERYAMAQFGGGGLSFLIYG